MFGHLLGKLVSASQDAAIARFAEAVPCRCRVAYHLSVDDPLLVRFGGASLGPFLERFGASSDEPIQHPFIDAAIQNAQKKIESQAVGAHETESAAAWLSRNLR